MNNQRSNIILNLLIVASFIPIVFLLDYSYFIPGHYKFLIFCARIAGIGGTIMLMWEFILGSRGIVRKLTPSLTWATNIHKWFGKYGTLIIFLHPIFFVIAFSNLYGVNLLDFNLNNRFSIYILAGGVAVLILLFIWLTSATLRSKLSFRTWRKLHLTSYIILPLVLYHDLSFGTNPLSRSYWEIMILLFIGIVIYQILFYYGLFRSKYVVKEIKSVGNNVSEITLQPQTNRWIKPSLGQFVYVQYPLVPETHPFTVSRFDSYSGNISFVVKDLGPFSHLLEDIEVGDPMVLDGPYGIFTREAYSTHRPIVALIGGIGITPILPIIEKIEKGWEKEVNLFYGNHEEKDIAFKERIDKATSEHPNFKCLHVLEKTDNSKYEKGFITSSTLRTHLTKGLSDYEYYICGPKPMLSAMQKILRENKVPRRQIHFEMFNY